MLAAISLRCSRASARASAGKVELAAPDKKHDVANLSPLPVNATAAGRCCSTGGILALEVAANG